MTALVVTALMVPQALGYAALAGAPVQAGLYALPVALVVYALLGSSPQLVVGPVSTVSVLTGSFVAARGANDPAEALALVTALAIISGGFPGAHVYHSVDAVSPQKLHLQPATKPS